jgi:IS5 family transposase
MATPANLPDYQGPQSTNGFTGQQSYGDLNDNFQDKIESIVRTNPSLSKDPQAVIALANSGGVSAEQTALALKWATNQFAHQGALADAVSTGSGPTVVKASSPSSISGAVPTTGYVKGNNIFKTVGQGLSTLGSVAKDVNNGASASIEDLGKTLWHTAQRVGTSADELVGDRGIAGYKDLWKTGTNLAENVNPANNQFLINLPQHMLTYEESMYRRHGAGYTAGQLLPALIGGVVTDGATAALKGTEAAQLSDQAIVDSANAASKSGQTLSEEQTTQAAEAAARLAKNQQELDGIKAAQKARQAARGPVFQGTAATARTLGVPLRALGTVTRFLARPSLSVRNNAIYGLTEMQAQAQDPNLWAQTANGTVIGADGKPVNAVAEALTMLGANPSDWFYKPATDLGSIYLTTFAADPFAAAFHVAGVAKSAEGFSGQLSRWWGGTGIRSADDIERTARQYPAVQKAYAFMATHNAAEIYAQFRGTVSEDLAKELGKAQDLPTVFAAYKQVLNTMGKVADGSGIVLMDSPKIGLWSGFKQVLKGTISKKFMTVGEVLGTDAVFMKDIQRQMSENKYDIRPDSAAYYAAPADVRWRSVIRRKFASQFYNTPMWVDSLTGKLESLHITPGDPNAIAPIMDLARLTMLPNETVKTIGDYLLHAKDPMDYTRAYTNIITHLVVRASVAGLPRTTLDLLGPTFQDEVFKNVMTIVGRDGGGLHGTYVANDANGFYSTVGDPKNIDDRLRAAIDDTQTGQLNMLRARDIRNLARNMRQAAILASKDARDITQATDDFQALSQVIRFSGVDMNSVRAMWQKVLADRTALGVVSDEHLAAHNQVTQSLAEMMAGMLKNKNMTNEQRFLALYDTAKSRSEALDQQLATTERWALDPKTAVAAQATNYEQLLGQRDAYKDIFTALNSAIPDTGTFSRQEFIDYARQLSEQRGLTGEAQKEFITKYADQMQIARQKDPAYRNNWQMTADFLNNTQSRVFVPLALLSNGWAIRVSISELLLNGFRMGWGNMLQSQLTNSILKHELVDDSRLFAHSEGGTKNILGFSFWGKGTLGPVRDVPAGASALVKSQNVAARGMRIIRDVVAGSLTGIEQSLLNGMDEAERLRYMDHTVSTVMRHKGYMPMDIHSQESVYNGSVAHNVGEPFLNVDKGGNIGYLRGTRSGHYQPVSFGENGYAVGLREALLRQGDSTIKQPLYQHLLEQTRERGMNVINQRLQENPEKFMTQATKHVKEYFENGAGQLEWSQRADKPAFAKLTRELLKEKTPPPALDELVLGEGAKTYNSIEAKKQLMDDLQARALSQLKSMTPAQLAHLRRSELTLRRDGTQDALENWAEALAHDTVHHVSGFSLAQDANGLQKPVFHGSLIKQAANMDDVKSIQSIVKEVQQMGESAPVGIPAAGFETYHALRAGGAKNLIMQASEFGHQRILGPIVNNLSRDPIWGYEFHTQMEKFEPLINIGVMTREQAEAKAETNALMNMAQFVHNPKDRLIFERNMRVLAPFYFAQNQSYRRFFRLVGQNPAAAEKYAKMCFALTNAVAIATNNGGTTSVYLPGSEVFSGLIANIFNWHNLTPQVGLAGSPTSINTVAPTGSQTGTSMLGTFFRPSWGPIPSISLKVFRDHFFQNDEFVKKVINDFLGPVDSSSPISHDVLPNTALWNILNLSGNTLGIPNAALISTQLSVMKATTSELYAKLYDENYKVDLPDYEKMGLSHETIVGLVRANTDNAFLKYFDTHDKAQQFLDEMHAQTLALFIAKTAVGMVSPVSISTMQRFSQEPKLQAILKEKNADGTPKYSLTQGLDEFAAKYPSHILDLITKTSTDYVTYPETDAALSFLTDYRNIVEKYKYGSAFLVPTTGNYSAAAYQLETSMGLRQMDSPQEYLDSTLVAIGNDYYYNYLKPYVQSLPGNSQTYSDGSVGLSYTGRIQLTNMTDTYAKHSNPTWGKLGGVINPTQKENVSYNAYNEIKAMLKDPKATPLFGSADNKNIYKQLIAYGDIWQQRIKNDSAAEAAQDRSTFYDWCQEQAKNPALKAQSYFLTSVLSRIGTKGGL